MSDNVSVGIERWCRGRNMTLVPDSELARLREAETKLTEIREAIVKLVADGVTADSLDAFLHSVADEQGGPDAA